MAIEKITVPDLGGAETVDVIELGLSSGDAVDVDDSLLVLESDKATMDVPSPHGGVFVKYLVNEGDKVSEGDSIAEIDVAGEVTSDGAEDEPDTIEEAQAPVNESAVSPEPQPQVATEEASELTVTVPDIGSDEQVDVIEISVSAGDVVEEGDTLVVLESDKATIDVPSSHGGKVLKVLLAEGGKAGTGSEVVVLEVISGGLSQEIEKAELPPVVEAEQPKLAPVPTEETAPQAQQEVQQTETSPEMDASSDVYAGPAVRLLARELGVDLTKVVATGPRGRIQKEDVNNYVKQALKEGTGGVPSVSSTTSGIPAVPDIDYSQFGEAEKVALTKIQKITAFNMHRSWLNVPHVTQFDDADISELEDFRKTLKAEGEKRGIKVTPVAFIIKAAALALTENPAFNRSLTADGENYVQKNYFHIGMAVDTERGLVVPVIRDVDKKGIWELSAEIAEIAGKARDGKLKPNEMQGGCFTVSSLGAIGGKGFTPIVNTPEVGILGVSKSQIQPVWNGSDFMPKLMLPLALSYDHRIINGGDAGRFMTYLVQLLSDIRRLAL